LLLDPLALCTPSLSSSIERLHTGEAGGAVRGVWVQTVFVLSVYSQDYNLALDEWGLILLQEGGAHDQELHGRRGGRGGEVDYKQWHNLLP